MLRFSQCCVALRSLLKLVSGIHPLPCIHPFFSGRRISGSCLRGPVHTIPAGSARPGLRVGAPGTTPPHAPLVNLCLSWTKKRTLPVLGAGMISVLHPLPLCFPFPTPQVETQAENPDNVSTGLTPCRGLLEVLVLRERRWRGDGVTLFKSGGGEMAPFFPETGGGALSLPFELDL